MSIAVTGATGRFGRHAVETLLRQGVPASQIIATGRDIEKIKDLADRGISVRRADFGDTDSLTAAFDGVHKLLLVSTTTPSERIGNHRRAIDAAQAAGVSHLVYTSTLHAESARMILAEAHRETERYVRASGIPFTIMRNGWYLENYTSQLPVYLQHGGIAGAAGQGRVNAASVADYAEAAAAVLATDGHVGAVYELGGDQAFTLAELAAKVSDATGQSIVYNDLSVDAYTLMLAGVGVPEVLAQVLADSDLGLARGELLAGTDDLRRLLGRPTTTPAEAIAVALAQQTEAS
ncbi:SDR family oxidoreductase [Streptomyces sp. NPDC101455]|uniref:SDR family oxidoreductase n=1 Tax=Streptomyces sp. NPDC101455 TaxID=3366142 RepID=UPI003816CA59